MRKTIIAAVFLTVLSVLGKNEAIAQAVMQEDSVILKQTKYQMNRDKHRQVGNDGKPLSSRYRIKDPKASILADRGPKISKGLRGRHIALWQSHGRYFDLAELQWKWQRPCLFQTTEDLFTQSFVVPFLCPMLENAGANVIMPRERDWHDFEIIMDNDPHVSTDTCHFWTKENFPRIYGKMEAEGKWKSVEGGFADLHEAYVAEENPFEMGSSLVCNTVVSKKAKPVKGNATVSWIADIPMHDTYAVYVSYKTSPKSTRDARYTIHTAGGPVEVSVNQKMGGSTWVYIGSHEFKAGSSVLVSLSNASNYEGTVSADAVRIGGGMGNVARGIADSTDFIVSGLPRFAEGARYCMQWGGIPAKVWSQNEFKDDYRDDLMSHGEWVKYLSGGSVFNPRHKGLNIPVDMTLAWHTDAGCRNDASIVGTLGIWTLRADRSSILPNGSSRATSRELTELMVSQLEKDLTAQWDSLWTIRDVWNRSYSESRTTGTPAVLLELLSHQNFEDMKYGLDPAFKFSASRAVYKAILKYLSTRYNRPYVVQALPVEGLGVRLIGNEPDYEGSIPSLETATAEAEIYWRERPDSLEPTATADYFILYKKVEHGGWDAGTVIRPEADCLGTYRHRVQIEPGLVYAFKIVAANEGGLSFDSEVVAVGTAGKGCKKVTVVNDFHRVSGPKWFDTKTFAGFDTVQDSGVPYMRDWSFVGRQFEFNRLKDKSFGEINSFGACYDDYVDKVIGGNTFDYCLMHGRALIEAGYSFDSCSSEAFACGEMEAVEDCWALDIICGKECKVKTGTRSPQRGGVWNEGLVAAVKTCVERGCNIMISGSYIATEAVEAGPELRSFVQNKLGFGLRRQKGSRSGVVSIIGEAARMQYPTEPVRQSYCVESPDALSAYKMGSSIYMEYVDSKLASAVRTDFGSYRVAAFGFPLEILSERSDFEKIMKQTLSFFETGR